MDIKERAVVFDGRRAHATEEFTGTRFAITFYAVKLWERVDGATQRKCEAVPWTLPTVKQLECFNALLPAPAGYEPDSAHVAQTMADMRNFVNGNLM